MKKKNFLYMAAAATALTFAACSSEDVVQAPDLITADMTTSYAKISVTMPSVGTRAMGEAFDTGSTKEREINAIYLALYNDEGKLVGTGIPVQGSTNEEGMAADVSNNTSQVFKLDLIENELKPTQVIAFVNYSTIGTLADYSTSGTLNNTEVLTKTIADFKNGGPVVAASDIETNGSNFPMTNSGYYDGSKYVISTDLNPELIFADASSASTGSLAATIYVERLAAKVIVNEKADGLSDEEQTADIIVKDGTNEEAKEVSLVFQTADAKWATTGTAKDMYLLKKQFTSADWMSSSYEHRSYWAEGTTWGRDYNNDATGFINSNSATNYGEGAPLNYLKYSEVYGEGSIGLTVSSTTPQYVPEHTYNYVDYAKESFFNVNVPSTSALIIGKYAVVGNDKDYSKGFYLVYGGADENLTPKYIVYTEAEMITYISEGDDLYTADGEDPETPIIKKENGKYTLTSSNGAPLYKDASDAETLVRSVYARHYVGGYAYFYVPIKHNAALEDEKGNVSGNGLYGIVRNHSYVININSVKGLGAPLDDDYVDGVNPDGTPKPKDDPEDPEPPIVPDPEELKDAYINASINVLMWHKITNNVDL